MEEYRQRHRAAYLARKNLQERSNNQQSGETQSTTPNPPPHESTQTPTPSSERQQVSPPPTEPRMVNGFDTAANGIDDDDSQKREQERADEELAQQLQRELNETAEPAELVRPPDNSYSEQLIGAGAVSNDTPSRNSYFNDWDEGPVHVSQGFMNSENGNSQFFQRQVFSSITNSQLFTNNNLNNPHVVDDDETHSEISSPVHPPQPPQQSNSPNDPISIDEEVEIDDDPDTALLQAAIAKSLVEM